MTAPARKRGKRYWGYALFGASIAAWLTFFGAAWLMSVVLDLTSEDASRVSAGGSPGLLAASAIFGAPVVLVICFVVGAPALVLLEVLKLSKWWQAALVGAAAGALLLLGALTFTRPTDVSVNAAGIAVAVIFMLTGATAGVTAWASMWLDKKAA